MDECKLMVCYAQLSKLSKVYRLRINWNINLQDADLYSFPRIENPNMLLVEIKPDKMYRRFYSNIIKVSGIPAIS